MPFDNLDNKFELMVKGNRDIDEFEETAQMLKMMGGGIELKRD